VIRGRSSDLALRAFTGKIAIVTGGASGIGRAIGAQLAEWGARVVLADIHSDGAERAAREVSRAASGNGAVTGHRLDTRDAAAFLLLADQIAEKHGRVDLLFNNAGIAMGGPTHELTLAHWERMIDVNIRGVVNGLLAVYPRMVEQRNGHIVNTASGAGLAPPPFVTPYAMSKHAVVGLSCGLRIEAALHGVRVSTLCPGSIETPILDRQPDADLPRTASRAVTAREYLAAIKQKPVPADRFARRALQQVATNQAVIVEPSSARLLWYLQRWSPRLMDVACARIARRVQRDLIRPRT